MTKPKADWLGWWIQLIFGIVVGSLLGCALASKGRYSPGWWLDGNLVFPFVIGAGLITGAIASQFGDRLWMENFSKFVFPDDSDIPQSNLSKICSILIGITGAGMMIYAILTTMKVI